MERNPYPNYKQRIFLFILYFAPAGVFLFLTLTVPQLFGLHLSELYFSVNSILAATFGLFPIMIYIEKKFDIHFKWDFKTPNFITIFLIIILAVLTVIITIPINNPSEFFKNIINGRVMVLMWDNTIFNWNRVVLLIGTVLLAPIIEEMLFRKQLFELLLKRYSPIISIIVTSLLFSVVHLRLSDFLSLFFWGFIFGMVYYKTKSLESSILLHSLSNLSTYLIDYTYIGITGIVIFKAIAILFGCVLFLFLILRYFGRVAYKYRISESNLQR